MRQTPAGERFPDWVRLRRRAEFTRVYDGGRKCVRRLLVVHVLDRVPDPGQPQVLPSLLPTRVGLTVSRKTGNSVVRNRIRRRLREIFRRLHADLAPGFDLVIGSRSPARGATSEDLRREFTACLVELGILAAPLPPPSSPRPDSSGDSSSS